MSKESNLGKGLLIGFLTGGVVGAAIALLFAPKSGKELRNDIKTKSNEFQEEAGKFIDIAKDKAMDLINEGKKKSEELVENAKTKADQLIKDAEKMIGDAKDKASHSYDSIKETFNDESSKVKSAFKAGVDAYKDAKNS